MKKIVNGSYIIGLSEMSGEDITSEEQGEILSAINSRPSPSAGCSYRLKTDLTWEEYELPPESEASGKGDTLDAAVEQAKKDAQAELETVVTELEAEVKTDEQ